MEWVAKHNQKGAHAQINGACVGNPACPFYPYRAFPRHTHTHHQPSTPPPALWASTAPPAMQLDHLVWQHQTAYAPRPLVLTTQVLPARART
eukprot:1153319-Pelagomonas_calceolata.AAC.1